MTCPFAASAHSVFLQDLVGNGILFKPLMLGLRLCEQVVLMQV